MNHGIKSVVGAISANNPYWTNIPYSLQMCSNSFFLDDNQKNLILYLDIMRYILGIYKIVDGKVVITNANLLNQFKYNDFMFNLIDAYYKNLNRKYRKNMFLVGLSLHEREELFKDIAKNSEIQLISKNEEEKFELEKLIKYGYLEKDSINSNSYWFTPITEIAFFSISMQFGFQVNKYVVDKLYCHYQKNEMIKLIERYYRLFKKEGDLDFQKMYLDYYYYVLISYLYGLKEYAWYNNIDNKFNSIRNFITVYFEHNYKFFNNFIEEIKADKRLIKR